MEVLRHDWLETSEERLAARYGGKQGGPGANGAPSPVAAADPRPRRPQPNNPRRVGGPCSLSPARTSRRSPPCATASERLKVPA